MLLCHCSSKCGSRRLWFAVGKRNNISELKSPIFYPCPPPLFLLIPSDLEHLPFLNFCFKTQVFLHQKKRPLKLVPALMSIFIIVNIFRAEMGVVHTCAILEPELIMLFYKMIIVGLFGSFFFFLMRPTAGPASLFFKHWKLITHINSAITVARWSFAEDAE